MLYFALVKHPAALRPSAVQFAGVFSRPVGFALAAAAVSFSLAKK